MVEVLSIFLFYIQYSVQSVFIIYVVSFYTTLYQNHIFSKYRRSKYYFVSRDLFRWWFFFFFFIAALLQLCPKL